MTETTTTEKKTIRQWLSEQTDPNTGQPLAKANSRGRFSMAAKAAVAAAYANGMEFLDDEPKAPPVPKEKRVVSTVASTSKVKAPERDYDLKEVRQWAEGIGLPVSKRGRISNEILAQYDANNPAKAKTVVVKAEKPRVRPENVAWGLTPPVEGHAYIQRVSVAFEKCGKCSNKIGWCSCDGGPFVPKYLGTEPAMLSKP